MKVIDLKNLLSRYDDNMSINLLDLSTDNETDMNYTISEDDIEELDIYTNEDDDQILGTALFICFDNKLNENPIT